MNSIIPHSPVTQAIPNYPNAQQVVIPQITIPQPQPVFPSFNQHEDLLRVNGMDGAKQFQTRPNSRYALFDENDDVFYVKETDQNNYPISLKRFRFVEEEEPVPVQPQYVTMEEFNQFREEMRNAKQSVRAKTAEPAASK